MEESQVVLYGSWLCPYVYRVIWALKLKGVKYEFITKDVCNMSEYLLKYNPVHKKIPVLVHGGNPVAESTVILEYIEETWPDRTPLLPRDPYDRAMSRFWINFGDQKGNIFFGFFLCSDEDKEKKVEGMVEILKIIEEKALGDKKFFGGNTISLVDLSLGWLAHLFDCIQEVVGLRVLEPTRFPRLHQWILCFNEEPVINQNLPDRVAMLEHMKMIRANPLILQQQ